MSTWPLLHLYSGGMLQFPVVFLRWWILASQEWTVPASWLMRWWASVSLWSETTVHRCTMLMRLYAMTCVVLLKLSPSSMWRRVSTDLGEIGGWWPTLSGAMHTQSRGGDWTSWTDGVGEWGTYWTNESVDETEMWQVCWSLNCWRSWVAKVASSPMSVGDSLRGEARELIDGLEFPNIL